ncbi:MAG: DUF4886 domain-containing protein [Clostridia bacterium]|nr:DUF4886 domain-containing protein [Clostridia bacterium]
MKKVTSLLALVLALLMLFTACGEPAVTTEANATTEASTTTEEATTATTATTEAKACVHEWEVLEGTAPGVLTEGTGKFKCKLCEETFEGTLPATKKIKILAIGNSFSVDAMETHLHKVFAALGIEATLGNLYIGGCSLDTHWDNIQNNKRAYTYYYKAAQKSTFTSLTNSINSAIKAQDWDIITIQQVSQDSGRPQTFNNLQNILDFIEANKTNPDAKIYWHMTWAYAQNSTHSGFANYNKDQMTMYNAIADAVENYVMKYDAIDGVIPSGTAIQNLRTSYIGDNLTRDGYHLNYTADSLGRLTASVTWAAALTGSDLSDFKYENKAYPSVAASVPAIVDAVLNAVKNPFEVTPSKYPPEPKEVIPNNPLTDEDKAILKGYGVNPDDYEALAIQHTLHAYYLSTSGSGLTSKSNSSASNLVNFIATQIFEKEQIPNGSIIYIKKGYQYRPEGWSSLNAKTNGRPDNVTTEFVVVDSAWWREFNYRAFNIAIEGAAASSVVSEKDMGVLKIYVPKSPVEEKPEEKPALPTREDLADTSKYTKLALDFKVQAYYNSNDNNYRSTMITGANSAASNIPNFAATQIFTKEELPVGAVIVVDEGYQYRPEGWIGLNTKTANRPGNVSTEIVVIDDAWWGSFTHRAFNLSKVQTATMKASDTAHFAIYIPVK